MDLVKKLKRRGTGYVLETELEKAYELDLIEKFKVQLYSVVEDNKPLSVYKIMVGLKGEDSWFTLSSRRYKDQAREFRDYNTIIKHIHSRYPNTESVQINLKPD